MKPQEQLALLSYYRVCHFIRWAIVGVMALVSTLGALCIWKTL